MRSLTDRIRDRGARALIGMFQALRIGFYQLASSGVVVEGKVRRNQPLLCHGRGTIRFAPGVTLGYYPSPGFFNSVCYLDARGEGAVIEFRGKCACNNGLTIIAEACKISIGHNVMIGPNVSVYDSDFHGLAITDRLDPAATKRGDVSIDDDVFIGTGAIILKGLRIGRGSVIAAGAIVTRDIPAGVIAAGNPARVVRKL